jgi:uncharacterized oligopeptide transporter (OPT) family protein
VADRAWVGDLALRADRVGHLVLGAVSTVYVWRRYRWMMAIVSRRWVVARCLAAMVAGYLAALVAGYLAAMVSGCLAAMVSGCLAAMVSAASTRWFRAA